MSVPSCAGRGEFHFKASQSKQNTGRVLYRFVPVHPYFGQSREIVIMFDDDENQDLRMTDGKRYSVKYPDLELTLDTKI